MITAAPTGVIVDYVDYFTKQLPLDMARLAQLRDELQKRQGAIDAVDAAIRDRDVAARDRVEAAAELVTARETADRLVREARSMVAENEIISRALTDREKAVEAGESDLVENISRFNDQMSNFYAELAVKQDNLVKAEQSVAAEKAALDERIRAFQEKVARLTV
jgi:chromosome segregation ATPase